MARRDSTARREGWQETDMGKFVTGLLIGLLAGLIFADYVFPDGFSRAVEQWSTSLQHRIPGR